MYVEELSEVSDDFARPGEVRWNAFYTDFTKHWLTHSSPYMKFALGLPSLPASASPLPICLNPAEQLDVASLALGGRISREPSLGAAAAPPQTDARRSSGASSSRASASGDMS